MPFDLFLVVFICLTVLSISRSLLISPPSIIVQTLVLQPALLCNPSDIRMDQLNIQISFYKTNIRISFNNIIKNVDDLNENWQANL